MVAQRHVFTFDLHCLPGFFRLQKGLVYRVWKKRLLGKRGRDAAIDIAQVRHFAPVGVDHIGKSSKQFRDRAICIFKKRHVVFGLGPQNPELGAFVLNAHTFPFRIQLADPDAISSCKQKFPADKVFCEYLAS